MPFTVLQSIFHHAKFFWLCSESETLQSYGNANLKMTIYTTLALKLAGIRKVVFLFKIKNISGVWEDSPVVKSFVV